jgi:hypothetical protein
MASSVFAVFFQNMLLRILFLCKCLYAFLSKIHTQILLVCWATQRAPPWASAGEGKRGTCHPWPAKMVCFLTFLKEKSIFFSIFWGNSMFLPCPRKYCPPLEKSLRTSMSSTVSSNI